MGNSSNREIEVKFRIASAEDLARRAGALGAVCEQQPLFERNLRYDDAAGSLSANREVLRLRNNGGQAVLTYKSDRQSTDVLADREEIETEVADFERTQLILERLGYRVFFIYEKYRSIYSLGGTAIFADHTPIGDYAEIEGPDEAAIRETAEKLGLNWEERIGQGYKALFHVWKEQQAYTGRDMTFDDIAATGSNA